MGSTRRSPPKWLTATGGPPPVGLHLHGARYVLRRVYKHDFFACTAVYERADDRPARDTPTRTTEESPPGAQPPEVVLKIGRSQRLFGLPMSWLGRLLAAREAACLRALAGVDGVPRLLERKGPTGLIREHIPGEVLRRGHAPPPGFHAKLGELVAQVHARGMACVDLEKPENVLLGEDGAPHLFDFQIAWYWPRAWGGELWPVRVARGWFQAADRYHLAKLRRRTDRARLSQEALRGSYRPPWPIRVHRVLLRPLIRLRRWALSIVDPRPRVGERGRVPEGEELMGANRE